MLTRSQVFKIVLLALVLLLIYTSLPRKPLNNLINERIKTMSRKVPKVEADSVRIITTGDRKDIDALAEYARVQITQPRAPNNLYELGMRLRILKKFISIGREEGELYEYLKSQIFPWAHKQPKLSAYQGAGKESKGIVICTGNEYFKFVVHSIRNIRLVHNCTLPIEVFYIGESDLSPDKRTYLSTLDGVSVRDITTVFDQNILKLNGWDAKPFSMLASTFSQTLLLDADTVLLHSPDVLFSDSGYQADGALFFHDRTLFPTDNFKREWLQSLFPRPFSSRLQARRFFQLKTSYEQEAGAVLIDKSRRLAGLLAACALNNRPERESVIHHETHGEKETFWLGFEMLSEPYAFMPSMPGAIGTIERDHDKPSQQVVCGKLCHFDRQGRPLWFNDSISAGKKDKELSNEASRLTHFTKEGKWNPFLCLSGKEFEELNDSELVTLERSVKVFIPDPLKTMPKK